MMRSLATLRRVVTRCDYVFDVINEQCARKAGHETAHLTAGAVKMLKDKYPHLDDDIDEMWMRSQEPFFP